MDNAPHPKGDLEVVGVSRSGRVRKKSSKLTDFQSPDDIETKAKKLQLHNQRLYSKQIHHGNDFVTSHNQLTTKTDSEIESDSYNAKHALDSENEFIDSQSNVPESSDGDDNDDMDEDDEDTGDRAESPDDSSNMIDSTARRSIYMTEKSKKKIMKDGKLVVVGKAQRKDKGKSRFTAYMLWSKDIRQEMLYSHPELDFSTISKRLGEMWANVPSAEKYNWKKRAKRFAAKGKTLASQNSGKIGNTIKFINKGTPGRKPKVQSQPETVIPTKLQQNQKNPTSISLFTSNSSAKTTTPISPGAYKITGQDPADVAAYLKLLGDSLTIIGERLKEHEGQITVSGSLSVLLDSLLCSIGPLMCLTNHIPALAAPPNDTKAKLAKILDNIAYIMPGL